jgi:putative glutamine amidotransferase
MTTKDRPLIGLNLDVRNASKGQIPFSCILSGYYDAILTSGGIPVLLPPMVKSEDMLPLVNKLDGLVLTGGDDMDPRKQNVPFHASVKIMSDRRETSDRLLCKLAKDRRLPTLAIGLGMQEMNVVQGGTLHVHVPEAIPKCLPHRDPLGGAHRHVVIMEPGTMMEEVYGEGEILVNSYHHQGVNKLAPIFRPSAFAPDGLLEAYEHHDLSEWWCVGVQWHPENEGHITLDTQLLEAFIASCTKLTKKPALAKAG